MITFKNYHAPHSVEEAYTLLHKSKRTRLLGGGAFLRMSNFNLTDVIDLTHIGLDRIHSDSGHLCIGAMVNFHALETSVAIPEALRTYFKSALSQIVGIQLRNMVTVGATVYSRYGFSDLNTALHALGAKLQIYKAGTVSMDSFFKESYFKKDLDLSKNTSEYAPERRDILLEISVPETFDWADFQSVRLSTADYAIVNLAAVKHSKGWRISTGARPHRAVLSPKTMAYLDSIDTTSPVSKTDTQSIIEQACTLYTEETSFGSNRLGSETYRRAAASGLLKMMLQTYFHEGRL